MAPPREAWRVAYAKQALADLRARETLLREPSLPSCQQLHFLQMACEKLCKAYLCGRPGADPAALQGSHAYIAKPLPIIVRERLRASRGGGAEGQWPLHAVRGLARRIELLSPAVADGGSHPANCEYPWLGPDGASVIAPCEHRFSLDLASEKAGRLLLKAVYAAAEELVRPSAEAGR